MFKGVFGRQMKALTEQRADEIIELSLADLTPRAEKLAEGHFCSDCPRKGEGCFPCKNAKVMIRMYLSAFVAAQSRWN